MLGNVNVNVPNPFATTAPVQQKRMTPQERAAHNTFDHTQLPNLDEVPQTQETSGERGLRQIGNASELALICTTSSSVTFLLQLLQAHAIAYVGAIAFIHLFYATQACGEGRNRFTTNLFTGTAAVGSASVGLAEPMMTAWRNSTTKSEIKSTYSDLYIPKPEPTSDMLTFAAIGIIMAALFILPDKK